jgi:macrolide phosphotransferase
MIRGKDELLGAARNHGLVLARDGFVLNESGLDFIAGFGRDAAGTEWVLRVPRRADVLTSADYEVRALSLVRERLPVAVPDWKVNEPQLIAYPRLPGVPAATIDPEVPGYVWVIDPQSPSETFLTSFAETVAALHVIDPEAATDAGLRQQSPAEARHAMSVQMEETRRMLRVSEKVWTRWQRWVAADDFWPPHSTLVHGDLHPGHILVDDDERVTGLLDWTEAEVSDPSIDFTLTYATLGPQVLEDVLRRYERAGGTTWPRMAEHVAERWSAYPVMTAAFVARTGEESHLVWAQSMLDGQA